VVQERPGHGRIGVRLKTYSHALPGLGREAVERLGASLHAGEGEDQEEPVGEGPPPQPDAAG
jgi:hypothetical protein